MSNHDDQELPLEPSAEVVTLFAAGLIRPADRVLDLGCFQGDDVVYLRTGGCDAIGIDASKTAIDYAAGLARNFNRYRRGIFRAGRVPEALTEFSDAEFDVVSDRLLLSNVYGGRKREKESAQDLVREVARILKPRGFYILRYGIAPEVISTARRVPMPDMPRSTIKRYFEPFSFQSGGRKGRPHESRPVEARLYPARSNFNADAWFAIMAKK